MERQKSEYTERGRGRGVNVNTNAEERVRVKIWKAGHRGRQTELKVEEIEIDAGVDMERGREKGKKRQRVSDRQGEKKEQTEKLGKKHTIMEFDSSG